MGAKNRHLRLKTQQVWSYEWLPSFFSLILNGSLNSTSLYKRDPSQIWITQNN